MSTANGRRPRWLGLGYSAALYLLMPIALWHTVREARRARDSRYLLERLGFPRRAVQTRPLWVHAASVGEVIAAEPLIKALRDRFPSVALALTTGTPTGAETARQRLPVEVIQLYLPIDLPGAVRRFLRALDPCCALILETEIWPNLYWEWAHSARPLLIINGRVSPRTLRARRWLQRLYASSLGCVSAVLARSPRDAEGFTALGTSPERVKVIGNLKFAVASRAPKTAAAPIPRPYVLAVSTHEDEERRLASLWRTYRQPPHLLVVAPRHPVRVPQILAQIADLKLKVGIHSRADAVQEDTELYLIDTLGELGRFMASAEVVFVGGSLVPHGGHNVLEPARLGRAIVFGPHMENFADEAALLLESEAAIQVADDAALATCFRQLLSSPQERQALGERAARVLQGQTQVLERYLQEIARYCPGVSPT